MAPPAPSADNSEQFIERAGLLLLFVALLFGGASRVDVLAPLLPRLVAICCLLWLGWSRTLGIGNWTWTERALWAILLGLPLIQLIPLPWSWWTALRGRDYAEQLYLLLGMQPWLGLSLTPEGTLNGWLALLPGLAIYTLARQADRQAVERWFLLLLALAIISGLLGLLQILGGAGSGLRFYAITNNDASVGIFSNANHHADFLAIGLILLTYWFIGRRSETDPAVAIGTRVAAILVIATLFGSTLLTFSRAGLIFTSVILVLAGLGVVLGSRRPYWQIAVTSAAFALAAGLTLWMFLDRPGVSAQMSTDIRGDGRLGLVPVFARIAWDHMPFGAGLGSFDPVYRGYEQANALDFNYLNNAHNDYAQLLIEAGIPALIGIALFLWWWLPRASRALVGRGNNGPIGVGQMRVAGAVTLLLLLHSLVDYPLRGAGLSTVFALACALLARQHVAKPYSRFDHSTLDE